MKVGSGGCHVFKNHPYSFQITKITHACYNKRNNGTTQDIHLLFLAQITHVNLLCNFCNFLIFIYLFAYIYAYICRDFCHSMLFKDRIVFYHFCTFCFSYPTFLVEILSTHTPSQLA